MRHLHLNHAFLLPLSPAFLRSAEGLLAAIIKKRKKDLTLPKFPNTLLLYVYLHGLDSLVPTGLGAIVVSQLGFDGRVLIQVHRSHVRLSSRTKKMTGSPD
jgi:hypothetical protein